jgi:hypothetical protein
MMTRMGGVSLSLIMGVIMGSVVLFLTPQFTNIPQLDCISFVIGFFFSWKCNFSQIMIRLYVCHNLI